MDLEQLKNLYPARLEKVNKLASSFQRQQLMRDLLIIAQVDEKLDKGEIEILSKLNKDMKLSSEFLDYEMNKKMKLD